MFKKVLGVVGCLVAFSGGCMASSSLDIWRSCSDVYQTRKSLESGKINAEQVNGIITATAASSELDISVKVAVLTKAQYALCPFFQQFSSLVSRNVENLVNGCFCNAETGKFLDNRTDYNTRLGLLLIRSQTEDYQEQKIKDGFERCIIDYAKTAQNSVLVPEEKLRLSQYIENITQNIM